MAAAGPYVGFGVSITFSSGFCAFITNVDWDGISRTIIDTSNNSLTTPFWRTFIPGKLVDPGSISVELLLDPNNDATVPITAAAASVTVTFPKFTGFTTAPTWAASGFMSDFKLGAPMDGVMTATANIKFSGAITVTTGS
jgi:hypothetical protein